MDTQPVAVAGLGLLGRGIASCLLAYRIPVVAWTYNEDEYASARAFIAQSIEEMITLAGFPASLRELWPTLYTEVKTPFELAHAGFVIESVIESAEAKIRLFEQLESVLPADIPIASNTSALPISLLQHGRRHPGRFLGMHWAIPAHATRFLELIRGDQTDDATMDATFALSRRIGKEPSILARDIPGFLANRMAYAVYREACNLLELGIADAETIDIAFRNTFGLWSGLCGPFRWIDITGGPALYGKAMGAVVPSLASAPQVPEPLAAMMHAGATGSRGGQGFYHYAPGEAAHWEEMYRKHVWKIRTILDETFPIPEGEIKT